MRAMPAPLDLGSARKFTVGNIHLHYREFHENPVDYPQAERMVMGYPLPEWQRPLRWTQDQQTRFLESIWLGIPFGFYVVNKFDWEPDGQPHPMSGLLIDGQQRFYALQRYFDNEYPVFGYHWQDLPKVDQRRFLNTPFPSYETSLETEEQARDLYNRLNFGGTPHNEDEMA